MKNKFIQTEYGHCVNYCLANFFNDKKFLRKKYLSSEGKNTLQGRWMVESVTKGQFTITTLIHSANQITIEAPVLDIGRPEVASDYMDCYNAYLVTVSPDGDPDGRHCLLAIHEHDLRDIHILDPHKEDSFTVKATEFFSKLKPYHVETFMNSAANFTIFHDIKHLQ